MAGKSAVTQYGLLRNIFCGLTTHTSWAATAGTTAWYVSLHTADPGEACSTANEGGYAAYARAETDRSTLGTSPYGWAVSSGTIATVAPTGNVDFPENTASTTGTFTHFCVFPSASATSTQAVYVGTVTPNINFGLNVTPRLTTGSSITED